MEIRLRRPLQKGDQLFEKIVLNLESLSGTDIIEAEKEARMRGDTSPNPLFSSEGLCIVAAKASEHIADDIANLAAPDFVLITNTVSNFLYGWVLPTTMQPETTEEQSS
ncbi:hypothetical protein [Paenibacillus ehimensis]|uniref:hypothetical protein n=1 Tax=Paenibacillus ehimensis TaxID=79264 RepID=UPI00047229A4|nr:hypothetical protein [Paenibacillus ehimensis]